VDAWAEVVEAVTGIDVDYRESGVGLDFYGRKTESMWFHIPSKKRAIIASNLFFAVIFQVLNLVFAIYYWDYLSTQTSPGVILINLPALASIICQVVAASVQTKEEAKLIATQPERFPAPVTKYIKEAVADWRSKNGKTLWINLKIKLDEFKEKEGHKGGGHGHLALMEIETSQPNSM